MYLRLLVVIMGFIVVNANNRVEIYSKHDKTWTCQDKGTYNKLCGTTSLPQQIVCKAWNTGHDKTLWECNNAENDDWILKHIHTCECSAYDTTEICHLHTIAIPKFDIPLIVYLSFFGIVVLCACCCPTSNNASNNAFWGAYVGSTFGSSRKRNNWRNSSWS